MSLKSSAGPDRKKGMATSTAELEELIESTITIPTIPAVLLEINRVVNSPDGSARDVANIIDRDPAIAAKALRLVNSSLYGLKNPVSSIPLACSILGLKTIKNLVVQATVLETFSERSELKSFDVEWLWDHSFKTAMAAGLLAKETTVESGLNSDDAYTAGLIHDVGKMVLLQSQADQFAEALSFSNSKDIPLAHAEEKVLGFSHAHVGGLLAKRWKLSEELQLAVMDHHQSTLGREQGWQGLLVSAANTVAHEAAAGNGGWIGERRPSKDFAPLGISAEQLSIIRDRVALASLSRG